MDVFVLKALVDELRQRLCGAVVSKVFQMSPEDLLLRLWRHEDLRLLLSVQASGPRLHLTTARFRNPPQPPRFAALLRAQLAQVRLCDIMVQPYDRAVSLCWARPGESAPVLRLLHELQGQQANILLLDAHDIILGALKHVPAEGTRRGPVLPGQPYRPVPLPPHRCLVSDLTVEALEQLQPQGTFDAAHLQRLVVGLSPVLATELVHRSQGEPQQCWELLQELRQQYEQGTLTLSIYTTPQGTRYLSALPLTHCPGTSVSFASAQEAVAAFYGPDIGTTALAHLRHTVQKTVQQRLQKLRHKMANLAQDRRKLESYLPYQRYGTLLVAQRVPRGATSVTVVDYYSPDQATVTIPLDPRLSLHDNAQVYFNKYRKTKHGLVKVQELLAQCAEEERYLEGVEQQIVQAEEWETLDVVALELGTSSSQGASPSQPVARHRVAVPTSAVLPYRTFVLRDGTTLYCGKHNQGNDVLLRQIATPEDIWLHAYRQAGAHVILKIRPGHEVPHQTLLQAAALAAFYSKGKDAASVDVMYTPAKYVRKFRGARPGQVQVTTYRTVEVAPQPPATEWAEGAR
jgi:predicted ribosome quality control (RQC) complex YloA/Tae2 family protein